MVELKDECENVAIINELCSFMKLLGEIVKVLILPLGMVIMEELEMYFMVGFLLVGLPLLALITGNLDKITEKFNHIFSKGYPVNIPTIDDYDQPFEVQYQREKWTASYILGVLLTIAFTVLTIDSYLHDGDRDYRSGIALVAFWIIVVGRFFSTKKIVLNNNGFWTDEKFVEWSEVEKVEFNLGPQTRYEAIY